MFNNLNAEYKGIKVKNVATKVGSVFGSRGREIGEKIDKVTENITIVIGKK